MEHIELIESAFVNYLATQVNAGASVWTDGLLILPGENNVDKDAARIVAYVEGDLGEEDPPLTGNRWADVVIELRTPFSKLTKAKIEAGAASPLEAHKANADALQTALLSVTLPEQLSAAIDGFTCFGLGNRTPTREQAPNYWSSGWKIRIYSCPSLIPA
jgi:hypothetical protein